MSTAVMERPAAGQQPARIDVIAVDYTGRTDAPKHATLKIRIGSEDLTFESDRPAKGPIEAICQAFESLVGPVAVEDWSGRSQGTGSDAVAKVDIVVRHGEKTFVGTGRHEDSLQATAEAVAAALNNQRWHAWKYPPKGG